jgi:MFS family permease
MLGLFLLLPVFTVAVRDLPGGTDSAKVGLAMGIYGLTQACLQIPLGLLSDRWGRRPVVLLGLTLFVVGSVVCALSPDVFWITMGRAVQGAGAISAAITAWLADATRDAVRTRAMALVGVSISVSFALAWVIAPVLVGWWGLPGLFWTIACLGVICLAVARWGIPVAPSSRAHMLVARPYSVFAQAELLRLNFGIFCLHLILMSVFLVVPTLLGQLGGLATHDLWKIYLPVIGASFVLMAPVIFLVEKYRAHRGALRGAVAGLTVVLIGMRWGQDSFDVMTVLLVGFLVSFNVLEALQPALVSRLAPREYKGLALGYYNTSQAAGLFCGGVVGGLLATQGGAPAVFAVMAGVALVWLWVGWKLKIS